jgi:hypothetical protein
MLDIDDLLLKIVLKLLLFSILSIKLYFTWLLFVYHNLRIEIFQICILWFLWKK